MSGGLVLCISRKDDYNDWGLPGGKLDPGETTEQALIREVREETGVIPITYEYIGTFPSGANDGFMVAVYHISKCRGIPKKQTDEGELAWHKPDTLLTKSRFRSFYQFLFPKLGLT